MIFWFAWVNLTNFQKEFFLANLFFANFSSDQSRKNWWSCIWLNSISRKFPHCELEITEFYSHLLRFRENSTQIYKTWFSITLISRNFCEKWVGKFVQFSDWGEWNSLFSFHKCIKVPIYSIWISRNVNQVWVNFCHYTRNCNANAKR